MEQELLLVELKILPELLGRVVLLPLP